VVESAPVLSALARHIDISCVQAFHDERDIRDLASAAREGGFVSAHVLPAWVPLLRELLDGSDTLAGAPAGFPSGGSMTATKIFEAQRLLAAGVQELDVVVNIGHLRSGDYAYVTAELTEVVALVNGLVPLRAILEVGYLDDDQVRAGCDCVVEAGVPWVKTGTGWSGRATQRRHVEIVAERVAGRAKIKAAGGIRDLDTVRDMSALGVTRFGMNATVARQLVAEATRAHSGGDA
jgi:deoxyribose-phosphate aldolase